MLQLTITKFLIYLFFNLLLFIPAYAYQSKHFKPEIQHATRYKVVEDINQYWVSEKLDGMRGYWDGQQLLTRQGNIIHSPTWFTKNWPITPMDGELWLGRDKFQTTVSCVRKIKIDEACWHNVRFMIFDLPKHTGTFTERIKAMKTITNTTSSAHLEMIKQFKLSSNQQLDKTLNNIISNQGEGLMLHKDNAYYHVGRTNNIMKLKKDQHAEARVIAYIGGKGKYQGMLGAITVQTTTGITFNIGSGFSDDERANPPEIGSTITYKYNGKTQAGIPRFARYFRIRNTEVEEELMEKK
ncbi:DNA ligase [Colwellia sp. 1_MG-2023]|uniref:DNA ligase n=1 Tax=unclassified Colwellia TaxID=196834 RepID=UPI001C092578|nr:MULTISPECIES: DNA ligase [unclassified Colwellia]MBU2925032.1 DNA ligase [Colwellia sp. C2M11]MDO6651675.1 DNA ligase [Colwellia sp. 3_MG-2023]MDO6664927.1 DNA ligase [Colwellia sp. 2_MG-2023]MDO6689300.1 DNA ligase [Colwellia sp. 1_MG-2023]